MFECKFENFFQRKPLIKKPECLKNCMDFEFPPQNFKESIYFDFRDLNEEILRMGLKMNFYRGRIFQRKDFEKANAKRLVYTCKQRGCPSKLIYLWTGQNRPIICQLFDNTHIHKKSSNLEKLKRQLIQQFILDMPLSQNWDNFKKWMTRFDIGERDAKFIVDQLYWHNSTQNEILCKMAFEGLTLRRIQDTSGNTLCVFIVTETMKKNYQIFGDVINFDVTYRMVKKASPFGGPYAVGYFMAQDTNLRLVMTAVCFYIKDEKSLLKQIFQLFLDLVCCGRPPNVIFTDDVRSLSEAISQIKNERQYTLLHFHDWFHVTQNLRQQLQQEPQGPKIFDLFCKALGECCPDVYTSLLLQIKGIIQQQQILQDFIAKQNCHCLSKMPTINQNFGILYRYSRKLNQRINQCMVFDTLTGRFYYNLIHFEKILERSLEKVTVINRGIIKHSGQQEIHALIHKLEDQIMDQLRQYYINSLDEDLVLQRVKQSDPLNYYIYSVKAQNSEGPKPRYFLHYSLAHGHWQCSCRIQYINGLPCSHIIKMLRQGPGGGRMEYYINTRWIHDKQDRIPEFSKPLISRKRRRP